MAKPSSSKKPAPKASTKTPAKAAVKAKPKVAAASKTGTGKTAATPAGKSAASGHASGSGAASNGAASKSGAAKSASSTVTKNASTATATVVTAPTAHVNGAATSPVQVHAAIASDDVGATSAGATNAGAVGTIAGATGPLAAGGEPILGADGRPMPPRPSRPPAPITGTAAMKNLAQRNAAAMRPATDLAELSGEAQRILSEGDTAAIAALGEALVAERALPQSCKIIDDVLAAKPDLLVGLVDRFVVLVSSPQKRTVQTVALALPVMARLAPARVARHLQGLTERFVESSEVGKDGLVSTFAALCMASVAYQKRLEPVLELALSSADPKSLQRWAEIILPSLKGEPHARARAVVEGRLPSMPRPLAQPIASFLGIKLRPLAP